MYIVCPHCESIFVLLCGCLFMCLLPRRCQKCSNFDSQLESGCGASEKGASIMATYNEVESMCVLCVHRNSTLFCTQKHFFYVSFLTFFQFPSLSGIPPLPPQQPSKCWIALPPLSCLLTRIIIIIIGSTLTRKYL